MEALTDALMERVDDLVHARDAPPEWGNPLAVRTEALEQAVREIALEVQKLSAQS